MICIVVPKINEGDTKAWFWNQRFKLNGNSRSYVFRCHEALMWIYLIIKKLNKHNTKYLRRIHELSFDDICENSQSVLKRDFNWLSVCVSESVWVEANEHNRTTANGPNNLAYSRAFTELAVCIMLVLVNLDNDAMSLDVEKYVWSSL